MQRTRALLAAAALALVSTGRPALAQTGAAAWTADLDLIKAELPKRHINLFFKLSRPEFERRIEQLKARVPGLNDDERYVEMSKVIAAVSDPHTALSMRPPRSALPVMLYRFRDGLYVTNTVEEYRTLLYGQVTAIGGHPIADVERAIGDMVPHENEATVWQALSRLLALTDVLHGLHVISDPGSASVTVRRQDGTPETVTMAAIAFTQRPQWVAGHAGTDTVPLYRRNSGKFYWYEYVADSQILYVKYNSCQEMKDMPFGEFTREVFERLDRAPGAKLVVDLRNNGGGNSGIFDPFLAALKQRPSLGERSRLYVVIGRQTFSSAILNAVALKQDAKAILVGEPTSGRPNHYGELQTLALPGTGLKVSYSTQYFKGTRDDPPSLMPDIAVDLSIQDLAAGQDPVLERIRLGEPAHGDSRASTTLELARRGPRQRSGPLPAQAIRSTSGRRARRRCPRPARRCR